MAILTLRAQGRPTIAGRTRTLALSGDSRFARVANMTGREVLGLSEARIKDTLQRLALRIQNLAAGLQPAYAFKAEGAGIKPIDLAISLSAGKISGSGSAHPTEPLPTRPMAYNFDGKAKKAIKDVQKIQISNLITALVGGAMSLSLGGFIVMVWPTFSLSLALFACLSTTVGLLMTATSISINRWRKDMIVRSFVAGNVSAFEGKAPLEKLDQDTAKKLAKLIESQGGVEAIKRELSKTSNEPSQRILKLP